MVKNLDRLNELSNRLKNKIEPYERIKLTLSMNGVKNINCVRIEDEEVEDYINFKLRVIVQKRINAYEELATKLTLNTEDLDYVEEHIDII